MKKRNEKHEKRVKRMIVACGLCAIILTASTYAWFIGMKTVNVTAFDVKIAAIDSLSLSLNGKDWSDTVEINETNHKTASYEGNTNSWGGEGLVPMSSVGKIDTTSSRMILFEKGSFTVTPGGYRIMASQVKNNGAEEAKGYVAFDLFIKNLSGNEYYTENNVLNEEAIYLTPESEVKVNAAGLDGDTANIENSGIENSVRVAFAQIGRVKSTQPETAITGITCNTAGDVTGICDDVHTQIWEPNDTKHVQNAINWYTSSCKKRTGENLTLAESYNGTCGTVTDGTAYPTYAVSGTIIETDQVDNYDGAEYNGYAGSVSETAATGKLMAYPYFTDTMKNLEGNDRPQFITLAPNSVTKVRIYVYLEGQDVDNYDFASLGRQISVAFGFTKERYYGDDINYNDQEPHGPELPTNVNSRTTKGN